MSSYAIATVISAIDDAAAASGVACFDRYAAALNCLRDAVALERQARASAAEQALTLRRATQLSVTQAKRELLPPDATVVYGPFDFACVDALASRLANGARDLVGYESALQELEYACIVRKSAVEARSSGSIEQARRLDAYCAAACKRAFDSAVIVTGRSDQTITTPICDAVALIAGEIREVFARHPNDPSVSRVALKQWRDTLEHLALACSLLGQAVDDHEVEWHSDAEEKVTHARKELAAATGAV